MPQQARFVHGSTMRHIVVMSSTGAMGLTALFLVDMLDLFFLSLLGIEALAAAVGYAGTISFFTTSLGIGLSIAAGALVSRAIGQRRRDMAGRYFVNVAVLTVLICTLVAVVVWIYIPELLSLLGAHGYVHEMAANYLRILVPSMPVIGLAMTCNAGLRAVGDARLSMNSTLVGSAVNGLLDPIFIFALNMDVEGAATASVLARFAVLLVAGYGMLVKHQLVARFRSRAFIDDLWPVLVVALPAIGTNIATPFGNAIITRSIADFGDGYVAGYAVIGRLIPVLFGMVFALSGAVGPIIGQNFGAHRFDRVKTSLRDAFIFGSGFVLTISLLLFLCRDLVINIFQAEGDAASLIGFFCTFIAASFIFNGAQFVANASFNNLGRASYSTVLAWGRATLGTIPFAWTGAALLGAKGVLLGQAVGGIFFSLASVILAFRLVIRLEKKHQEDVAALRPEPVVIPDDIVAPCTLNPLSSDCSQLGMVVEEADCEESGRCLLPESEHHKS